MYFTPDFKETCTDEKLWKYLDSLEWRRDGQYLFAFTESGIRVSRGLKGKSNVLIDPLSPKIHPNGNSNFTWDTDEQDPDIFEKLGTSLKEKME